jgi:hypothetical protein
VGPTKRKPVQSFSKIIKTGKSENVNKKVNKGLAPSGGRILQLFCLKNGSDLSFIIPDKTGHIGSVKTSQGIYLIFDEIYLKPSKIKLILVFLL